jgi:prolyl 4-hydroxylase
MEHATAAGPEADAAHALAIAAAEGAGVPQDWAAALDHLRHSARLGSRLAQAELAGLAGEWALAHDILAEEAVPEARGPPFDGPIDLAPWLEPPRKRMISEQPRIAAVEDIATPELCAWLIARARAKLARATILDRGTGERRIVSNNRTNSVCDFRGPDSDLILALLRARIAAVTAVPAHTMESAHILHYAVGQEFRPHFDAVLDPGAPDYGEKLAAGRQRVVTFLMALNDDYDGGETEFPALGLRWKARRGRALFFWNVEPGGALDQRSLHAGRPVTRGEKWLLSQWIQGRPAAA